MSVYTLDTDLVVQNGDAQWRLLCVLDTQHVQLQNQATGGLRQLRISKLASDIACGKVVRKCARPVSPKTASLGPYGPCASSRAVLCTATDSWIGVNVAARHAGAGPRSTSASAVDA